MRLSTELYALSPFMSTTDNLNFGQDDTDNTFLVGLLLKPVKPWKDVGTAPMSQVHTRADNTKVFQ